MFSNEKMQSLSSSRIHSFASSKSFFPLPLFAKRFSWKQLTASSKTPQHEALLWLQESLSTKILKILSGKKCIRLKKGSDFLVYAETCPIIGVLRTGSFQLQIRRVIILSIMYFLGDFTNAHFFAVY